MRNRFNILILFAGLIAVPMDAHSASSGVSFGTVVNETCTIIVRRDGILDPRSNFTRLTSRSGPGKPGRANIIASAGGFQASVDAPTAFNTEPALDTTPETFRAWHRSRGATSYNLTQGVRTLNPGTSRIIVHMDARKSGGNVFEAGNYTATVVLRCE